MGEMADFALGEVFDFDEDVQRYRSGQMSDQDAYESGIIDEMGYEPSARTAGGKLKTCKYCGQTGLNWKKLNGKWRLHKGLLLHHCPVNPLKEV